MSRRAFELYALLAPAILAPAALALWWRSYGQWGPALVAWGVPIAWAYIVPGVGTNLLKVWEFDVERKLGRFRPQHGFVFGSASAALAWLVHRPSHGLFECLCQALIFACVLGIVNLIYDVAALRSGILRVYNEPWAAGESPEAIALDYSLWFFGGFGGAYGLCLGLLEWLHPAVSWMLFLKMLAVTIAVPVLGYALQSRRRHGHWGIRPTPKRSRE